MQRNVIITKLVVISALAASLLESVLLVLITIPLKGMVFWLVLLGLSACVFAVAGYRSLRASRVPPLGYWATVYAGMLWIYMQYVAPHVSEPFGYVT